METIKIENLSFAYPLSKNFAISNICLSINEGEFITICGKSGCGKSTLLRQLKPVIAPKGILNGNILLNNKLISEYKNDDICKKIGFVTQSPENQLVTDKVWHELSFGLENLGYDANTIKRKIAETANFFGIENWFYEDVSKLSGGQKQILNLAAIMVMNPDVLVLDEPCSQLDPIVSSEFINCLTKINREIGTTVIIAEHNLEKLFSISDRIVVMDNGKIVLENTPEKLAQLLNPENKNILSSFPAPLRIFKEITPDSLSFPLTITSGKDALKKFSENHDIINHINEEKENIHKSKCIEVKNIFFRYEKNSDDIIKELSIDIYRGELLTILGGNGAGKSTLLSLICKINKPFAGKINYYDNQNKTTKALKTALLVQNPKAMFVKKTVLEDLVEVFDTTQVSKEKRNEMLKNVISLCRLSNLLDRHPFDLSGGEIQRAALAKLLLINPEVILLDEPTKGMDCCFKEEFASIIKFLVSKGTAVVMVSHDIDFCAQYSDRCVMLFDGNIVCDDTAREFFSTNNFYTTSASRMSRTIIDNAITCDDVIYCCTRQKPKRNDNNPEKLVTDDKLEINTTTKMPKISNFKKVLGSISIVLLLFVALVDIDVFRVFKDMPLYFYGIITSIPILMLMFSFGQLTNKAQFSKQYRRAKAKKRTVVSALLIFLLIPLTIFIGITYFNDEKYLFISILVLAECMIPFFMIFEGQKPQTRELVIISVLCAIAVAGRIVFTAFPQFKPVLALVIIAATAFGAETGFLVGAVTMIVSNMIFGQGPWTPWQMFAMGIIGFFAGLLFNRGIIKQNRFILCTFGFISALLIYGPLMNISTAIISQAPLNFATIVAYCTAGLPMDIVNALATIVFLFFGAEPMLQKLERVKVKYDLVKT